MAKIGKKEALFVVNKMKSELIHNMLTAEGSTLTFIDTKTLIEDKVTPSGKPVEDVEQALRLGRAFDEMISQVRNNSFEMNKENFIKINSLVAVNEALSVGNFRYAQVYIGDYTPPAAEKLDDCFNKMMQNFLENDDIEEKASDLFLDSARNQYFFDGNKRTAQIMMNGFLILNEHAPRSIQKEYLASYNEKMARFYHSNDKKEMREFLGKSQALSAIVFRAKHAQKNTDRRNKMKTFDEILKHSLENGNVGERLLAKGETIVYCADDLQDGEFVRAYPDGRKFIIRTIDGVTTECEPYNG